MEEIIILFRSYRLCLPYGHDTKCKAIRQMDLPLARAAVSRDQHRLPLHPLAAPNLRGRRRIR